MSVRHTQADLERCAGRVLAYRTAIDALSSVADPSLLRLLVEAQQAQIQDMGAIAVELIGRKNALAQQALDAQTALDAMTDRP